MMKITLRTKEAYRAKTKKEINLYKKTPTTAQKQYLITLLLSFLKQSSQSKFCMVLGIKTNNHYKAFDPEAG